MKKEIPKFDELLQRYADEYDAFLEKQHTFWQENPEMENTYDTVIQEVNNIIDDFGLDEEHLNPNEIKDITYFYSINPESPYYVDGISEEFKDHYGFMARDVNGGGFHFDGKILINIERTEGNIFFFVSAHELSHLVVDRCLEKAGKHIANDTEFLNEGLVDSVAQYIGIRLGKELPEELIRDESKIFNIFFNQLIQTVQDNEHINEEQATYKVRKAIGFLLTKGEWEGLVQIAELAYGENGLEKILVFGKQALEAQKKAHTAYLKFNTRHTFLNKRRFAKLRKEYFEASTILWNAVKYKVFE